MERIELILYYTALAFAGIVLVKLAVFLLVSTLTILSNPSILGAVWSDLRAIRERDPAAEGWIAAMYYPGWWALSLHRVLAHPLYKVGLRTPARLVNFGARLITGSDIHPGAQFGRGIFIDHAHGVVIGETAVVGDNVTILHQVTLGGTGKDTGKRHPTVDDGVLLSAGAKILGNIHIGKNAKIGAGSVVVKNVPADSTVVGVPGRVVVRGGTRIPATSLDQTTLPDPVVDRLMALQDELREWERRVEGAKDVVKGGTGRGNQNVLDTINEHKRDEVERAKLVRPMSEMRQLPSQRTERRCFYDALAMPGLSLIAEIKKASPSGGLLRPDFNPPQIAETYAKHHARALSVLTDEKYFQGKLDYLAQVRKSVKLPLLRKDFILDEYQVVEAERAGADAVLLIVASLDDKQLHDLYQAAQDENLDALIEVHDEAELERAMKIGARILGINNRNLKSMSTTLDVTERLSKCVPDQRDGLLLVSESGIRTHDDITRLTDLGVDAVLIGETFMKSPDIGAKVNEVMGEVVARPKEWHI